MESVVLVHGLWMTGVDMSLLRWRLGRCGFSPYQFRYHSLLSDLATNAARLQRYVRQVPGEVVHLVGHSLGGLVIRQWLRDFPDQRPGRIVTLGTPHCASIVARHLHGSLASRWILGRSAGALCERLPPWDGAREMGSIAGNLPIGGGRLFRVLRGENDGTVAVEETWIPALTDHLVLPVTHMGLVTSATVAHETCRFLRSGHFGLSGKP